jgi:hypothetical protein
VWTASAVLARAAFIAGGYSMKAQGEVRYNLTDSFHLCGLIERAASMPKSGATHRRDIDGVADEAKALFCRAHKVLHPLQWEYENKPTCEQVRQALLRASEAGQE